MLYENHRHSVLLPLARVREKRDGSTRIELQLPKASHTWQVQRKSTGFWMSHHALNMFRSPVAIRRQARKSMRHGNDFSAIGCWGFNNAESV